MLSIIVSMHLFYVCCFVIYSCLHNVCFRVISWHVDKEWRHFCKCVILLWNVLSCSVLFGRCLVYSTSAQRSSVLISSTPLYSTLSFPILLYSTLFYSTLLCSTALLAVLSAALLSSLLCSALIATVLDSLSYSTLYRSSLRATVLYFSTTQVLCMSDNMYTYTFELKYFHNLKVFTQMLLVSKIYIVDIWQLMNFDDRARFAVESNDL